MPKAIVLGGYGLIGSACMRALADAGFDVTGMGRSRDAARTVRTSSEWLIRDIPAVTAQEWRGLLSGVDVVVNASGALQDGARDDLEAIHVTAVERLVEAAGPMPVRIVQISAAGVSPDASTAFLRSKARGDAIVSSRAKDWVILRPTLVLSPDAYGGTALLRAVAGLPGVLPRVLPESQVQTVHVGDVAAAVVAAARGEVPAGTVADLTERETRTLPELAAALRRWQGRPVPVFEPAVPSGVLSIAAAFADLLGHLGWRSPLRSTALDALEDGVRGDPEPWETLTGGRCRSLEETLALLPATPQERLFSRAYLALPLAIATLAVFWCLSGVVALVDVGRATAVLTDRSVSPRLAGVVVVGGALADMLIGLAILWRPWTKPAALAMLGLSAAYLLASLPLAPGLWADPLGPMVKVLPGMALAAVVWLLMEGR